MAQTGDTALREKWARAYAAQSRSDFNVYLRFPAETEECHRLHYLQMACEKIAKAYRLRDTRTQVEEETRSHVAFSLFVENLLVSPQIKQRYRSQGARLRWVASEARALAREIEKLAPAVDRQRSPVNAEYPGRMIRGFRLPATSAIPT